MVYDTYRKLIYKSKDNKQYENILNERLSNLIDTGLPTRDGKSIKLSNLQETDRLLQMIESEYKRVMVTSIADNYIVNESYSTCAIEGSRATLEDTIRIFNTGGIQSKSDKMVYNNINAIKSIKGIDITSIKDTEGVVLGIWRTITNGVCDNIEIQGDKYRIGNVGVVGPTQRIIYKAPDYTKVQIMMDSLYEFTQKNKLHPIMAAIIIHYYFVYIHPFCDGNGRMARLLLNQYLINNGYNKFKMVSITTEVYKNVKDYYKSLEYSDNEYNDITFFVLYYLNTIYSVLKKINSGLGVRLEDVVGQLNHRQVKVVKFLKNNRNNFITQSRYSESYKVSKSTAAKELNTLVNLGLLKKEMHTYMIYKWWEYDI